MEKAAKWFKPLRPEIQQARKPGCTEERRKIKWSRKRDSILAETVTKGCVHEGTEHGLDYTKQFRRALVTQFIFGTLGWILNPP